MLRRLIKGFIILAILNIWLVPANIFAETDGVGVSLTVPEESVVISASAGCKDPLALNYDPEADISNPDECVYPQLGCTDPEAENYDPLATANNNTCTYVPMASNFSARYDSDSELGVLTWNNPANFNNFAGVRIVRKTGSVPTSITDGQVVYDGQAQNTTDADLEIDVRYYYALFVRSTTGHYSAPLIASLVPGKEKIDDPFELFPQVKSNLSLKLGDFIFSQPGEKTQYFGANGLVIIKGDKIMTVSLPYNKVPEVLKTIGITLHDPVDINKTFSFTLRLNSTKTAYTATVAPLGRTGTYKVNIYVLNFSDQTMKKITGNLIVATPGLLSAGTISASTQIGKNLAIGAGLGAVALQTIALTSHFSTLADLYLILMRIIGAILGFFGWKKKSKPWGTVYDAVTKRPIDPAYISVELVGTNKEVSSAITDIDGRYGFFLPAGQYVLKAGKTHYAFPSQTLNGRDRDELYDNLYFGEEIRVIGEEVLNKNIPLDPIGFDWNEFAKSKSEFFKVYSSKEIKQNRIYNGLYFLGFAISLGSMIYTPSWFDAFTLIVYIVLFIFQKLWLARHRPVQIKNNITGEPLPFAIVRFYLADLGTEVRSVVADELGRFFALLRPGKYFYTVEEKQDDGSYKRVLTSTPIEMKRGLVAKNILV